MQNNKKAIFLDRDGTLILDHGYIKDQNMVEILPKVNLALQKLKDNGFLLFIVTNQSGVGRGMMSMADVDAVNNKLLSMLGPNIITEVLVCPHSPKDSCKCRKPATELVYAAAAKYNIDLKLSYAIGDKDSDKELGINMGGTGIKIGEAGIKDIYDAAIRILRT